MSRHEKLELLKLAACGSNTCPTIYRTTHGTFVVQGSAVDPESVDVELGPGELLVEIPESLLAGLLADRERPAP